MFFVNLVIIFFFLVSQTLISSSRDLDFTFNDFLSITNLTLDGIATVTPNGLLRLTNFTNHRTAHAFYRDPVRFKASPNDTVFSFSTTFVYAGITQAPILSGHGTAFVVGPSPASLSSAFPSQFLGLFTSQNDGNVSNHVFAVELDTIQSSEFGDINDNHVGIDINTLRSERAEPAGYWDDNGRFMNVSLISGKQIQVWIEYDGLTKQINVTMAPLKVGRPKKPLLSLVRDLSPILLEEMYVGFSSSTGSVFLGQYILGWSFRMNGEARPLVLSKLPRLPRVGNKEISEFYKFGLPLIFVFLLLSAIFPAVYIVRRRRMFAEEQDDWETEYRKNRFRFKDLYYATKGFKDREVLGMGGFGKVYRGTMPRTKLEVAVKRVSHESRQGMREFVAEIVSIGRMSHRNLVPLLGYCRRKGELLLVYDYMPNGSLDRYLHNNPEVTLTWKQRFKVINGVASSLVYLHEEWEQVVIHRDVKASNVLLDAELNGRLGDFGLARLHDHGSNPQTTHVVGTVGYLAPEHTRTGKATTATDVFAFGAFLLEVACGRRPIEYHRVTNETFLLVDWVYSFWCQGNILSAKDPNLGPEYDFKQVELVLKLGLLCSQSDPRARPSMRQVLHYLKGDTALPDMSPLDVSENGLMFATREGFSNVVVSCSSTCYEFTGASSIADSLLSGGR